MKVISKNGKDDLKQESKLEKVLPCSFGSDRIAPNYNRGAVLRSRIISWPTYGSFALLLKLQHCVRKQLREKLVFEELQLRLEVRGGVGNQARESVERVRVRCSRVEQQLFVFCCRCGRRARGRSPTADSRGVLCRRRGGVHGLRRPGGCALGPRHG